MRRRGGPAPWYSHVTYDIVPGKEVVVRRPDVLIVEGLNVLAPARPRQDGRQGLALSDFFDFSIYVDAKTSYIEEWYMDRFLQTAEHGLRPAGIVLPPLRNALRCRGRGDCP